MLSGDDDGVDKRTVQITCVRLLYTDRTSRSSPSGDFVGPNSNENLRLVREEFLHVKFGQTCSDEWNTRSTRGAQSGARRRSGIRVFYSADVETSDDPSPDEFGVETSDDPSPGAFGLVRFHCRSRNIDLYTKNVRSRVNRTWPANATLDNRITRGERLLGVSYYNIRLFRTLNKRCPYTSSRFVAD